MAEDFRLKYGVDLRDVWSGPDIHPRLLSLLSHIICNIDDLSFPPTESWLKIQKLKRKLRRSRDHPLLLLQHSANCAMIALTEFLEKLPVPVMGVDEQWESTAHFLKRSLLFSYPGVDQFLITSLKRIIHLLPEQNLRLLQYLIGTIRLCTINSVTGWTDSYLKDELVNHIAPILWQTKGYQCKWKVKVSFQSMLNYILDNSTQILPVCVSSTGYNFHDRGENVLSNDNYFLPEPSPSKSPQHRLRRDNKIVGFKAKELLEKSHFNLLASNSTSQVQPSVRARFHTRVLSSSDFAVKERRGFTWPLGPWF